MQAMNIAFEEPSMDTFAGHATRHAGWSAADCLWSGLRLDDPTSHPPTCGLALPVLSVDQPQSTMLYAVTAIDIWG